MIVPFTDRVKKAWVSRLSHPALRGPPRPAGAAPPCGGRPAGKTQNREAAFFFSDFHKHLEDGSRKKSWNSRDQGMTLWFILNWSRKSKMEIPDRSPLEADPDEVLIEPCSR